MHKIEYYNRKFRDMKEQGSDDWLEGRRYSFGGSEIATVFGKNPYDTFETMIHNKKNRITKPDDKTEWGHLFEPVAKKFINEKYGFIYDYSSIAHPYYPIAYSPDGILMTEDNEDIMLLEIKNPIYRNVSKIPEHYMMQVQLGMCIFNVKCCLFAQYQFRRCTLNTSPTSKFYDWAYHKEWKRKCTNEPLTFGYLYWDMDCDLVDLGKVDSILKEIYGLQEKCEIYIGEHKKFTKGKALMWKLFDIDYKMVDPVPDYLKDKEKILWEKYKEMLNVMKDKPENEKFTVQLKEKDELQL